MKIGIIVAMDKERNLVVDKLSERQEFEANGQHFFVGKLSDHQVVLLQSGIGKVAAAVGAVELIRRFEPDYIINTGVAGALDSSVGVMDVVVGTQTVYHDVDCFTDNPRGCIQGFPLYFDGAEKLIDVLKTLTLPVSAHFGLMCTGDQFVSKIEILRQIKGYFPQGLAVDMESNAIAQVCYMYNVPFLSLRIISDTPGVTNHENQYFDFWTTAPKVSFEALSQLISNL